MYTLSIIFLVLAFLSSVGVWFWGAFAPMNKTWGVKLAWIVVISVPLSAWCYWASGHS